MFVNLKTFTWVPNLKTPISWIRINDIMSSSLHVDWNRILYKAESLNQLSFKKNQLFSSSSWLLAEQLKHNEIEKI